MTRVAVYFAGHLRNLQDNWANYKRVFSHPHIQFDFYFTLWRKSHTTTSTSWQHSNVTGKKLVEIRDITEGDVYCICPEAKAVNILDEISFGPEYAGYGKNIIPQLHCIRKAFLAVPKDYDYYIRMRTDLYFFKGVNWPEALGDCVIPSTVHFGVPNYPSSDLFNEFIWIGNYEANLYITSIYDCILSYDRSQITERLYRMHMDVGSLKPRHYPFEVVLERRTRGFDGLPETGPYTERRRSEGDFI
jgi:hypothetical protein